MQRQHIRVPRGGFAGSMAALRAAGVILPLALGLAAAQAQSVAEVEQRRAALIEAWQKTPLTVQRALFLEKPAEGYGIYQERSSKTFHAGEPIIAYAEPLGYGWKKEGEDSYEFGLTADFILKTPNGKVLGGQQDFVKLIKHSHHRNLELFMTLTLHLTGAPAGDYVIEYTLHDVTTGKSATVEMPFTLAQ